MSRTNLYNRLPLAWKRLDIDGVLERYLGVFDNAFDNVESKANDILSLRNAQTASDKYIHLLGKLVGHNWDSSKAYSWNRSRIQHAIHRYSYKGTSIAVEDLAHEYGSEVNLRQDNASKLLILGKQGRLGCEDAYLVSSDYWHDGAFLYEFKNAGDTEGLAAAILDIVTAGEIWFTNFVFVSQTEFITDYTIELLGTLTFTNAQEGSIGFGILGQSLILSAQPSNDSDKTYLTTTWSDLFSKPIGSVGYGLLGSGLFVSNEPAITSDRSFDEIGWHISEPMGSLGYSLLGTEIFLSVEPA